LPRGGGASDAAEVLKASGSRLFILANAALISASELKERTLVAA
jgi:hypothetical protein